jgi:hypothetical protein
MALFREPLQTSSTRREKATVEGGNTEGLRLVAEAARYPRTGESGLTWSQRSMSGSIFRSFAPAGLSTLAHLDGGQCFIVK